MAKIIFDPGADDKEAWVESLVKQTPEESGVWEDVELVDNAEDADYQISINWVGPNPDSIRTLLFTHEPPCLLPESRWASCDVHETYPLSRIPLPQIWRFDKTYDELKATEPMTKSEDLSWIITNKGQSSNPPWFRFLKWYRRLLLKTEYKKYQYKYLPLTKRLIERGGGLSELMFRVNNGLLNYPTDGHIMRMDFLEKLISKYPEIVDVYGWGTWDESTPYYCGVVDDKWDGLAPYRYSLAISNYYGPNYFLKVTGPLLAWCMPITWGCTNLGEFLPEDSFVEIDIENNSAVEKVKRVVESDLREQNIDAIAKARELILDEHQYWPVFQREIANLEDEQ